MKHQRNTVEMLSQQSSHGWSLPGRFLASRERQADSASTVCDE